MSTRQVLQVGDAKRIRFAIRLASADDVATLPRRTTDALWRGEMAFVGIHPRAPGEFGIGVKGPADVVKAERERRRASDIELLRRMQQNARELLELASAQQHIRLTMKARSVTVDGPTFAIESDPVETFTIQLAWLLTSSEAGRRVRKCPECGRFFLRVRRQIYCEDACTDRATWRNYPEEKKQRARQREYEKYGWMIGAKSARRKTR